MRSVVAAMAFVLMVLPAHSQSVLKDNSQEEDAARALEKKKQAEELDKRYNATIRATGSAKEVKSDPWGGIREVEAPKPRPAARPKN